MFNFSIRAYNFTPPFAPKQPFLATKNREGDHPKQSPSLSLFCGPQSDVVTMQNRRPS